MEPETTKEGESKQSSLRRSIQEIQRDTSLDAATKAKRIQTLMTASYSALKASASVDSPVSAEKEAEPTYFNEEDGILGCKHYQRGCKLKASCCQRMFTCRLCHNEEADHELDRYATQRMLCMHCGTEQAVSQKCENERCCKVLGEYYCDVCKFHNNDEDKAVYHCPDCGLCRLGRGLGVDQFHCPKCNICLNLAVRDSHTCIENCLSSNCPICHDFMFTSRDSVIFMECGHPIHHKCQMDALNNGNWQCPTCKKSMFDMSREWSVRDREVELNVMPEEFADSRAEILCNDCNHKTNVTFHFVGLKCARPECGSYNTSISSTSGMPRYPPSGPVSIRRLTSAEVGEVLGESSSSSEASDVDSSEEEGAAFGAGDESGSGGADRTDGEGGEASDGAAIPPPE